MSSRGGRARVGASRYRPHRPQKRAPAEFRDAYWALVDHYQRPLTIQFTSDDPHLPWELMRPTRQGELHPPLALKHAVARWIGAYQGWLRNRLPQGDLMVVAPRYGANLQLQKAQETALSVVARYRAAGADVVRTDFAGATQWRFSRDGSEAVHRERIDGAAYWHNQPIAAVAPGAAQAGEAARREAIEAQVKTPLFWHDVEGNKQRRIYVRKDADFRNRNEWPGQFEWLGEHLEKFGAAFGPLVKSL